jgi:spore coat-associated protein N
MKKIVGLIITALLIIGIVGGGTYAYFSDTESSTGNTLTAGTLDLNINGGNVAINTFDVGNVAPGDSGSANCTLANVGSIPGELDVTIAAINNTAGAGGTQYEGGSGELGANAEMALYFDVDESGGATAGDSGLKSDGTLYDPSVALDYDIINNYVETWDAADNITAGISDSFVIDWQVPDLTGNDIQGDSVSFDITFTLEQPEVDP